jgi:hypothetical protein
MRMDRSALLAFQHGYVRHWIAIAGQHTPKSFQITEHSFSICDVIPVGERDEMIGSDRKAFPPDLAGRSGSGSLLILLRVP